MPDSKHDLPAFPRLDTEADERTEIDPEMRFALRIGYKPWLLVVEGKRCLGRLIEIRNKMIIGRSAEADVVLDEDGISRKHALVEVVHGGVIRVADLDSRNGVRVGGRRVRTHALREGERVRLGDAVLTLIHAQDNTRLFMDNLRASVESFPSK